MIFIYYLKHWKLDDKYILRVKEKISYCIFPYVLINEIKYRYINYY